MDNYHPYLPILDHAVRILWAFKEEMLPIFEANDGFPPPLFKGKGQYTIPFK